MPNFIWPVPLYRLPDVERVSSEWGPRVAPVPGASTFHRGIDMGWCNGMVYVAPAGGVITHVGWNGGEGFSIHMRADDDTVMKFFHSVGGSNQVNVGDRVTQGQGLATVGDTGVSGGPHMHWEVWIGGTQNVNPRDFMNAYSLASSNATPFDNQEDDMYNDDDRARDTATNQAMGRVEQHAWYLHKVIDELRFVVIGNNPGETITQKLEELGNELEAAFPKSQIAKP